MPRTHAVTAASRLRSRGRIAEDWDQAGKEVDRLGRRDALDLLRLELKQHDALHEPALELRVTELGGDDLAGT